MATEISDKMRRTEMMLVRLTPDERAAIEAEVERATIARDGEKVTASEITRRALKAYLTLSSGDSNSVASTETKSTQQ